MDGYEKFLAFAQLASIIIIWIRFESRLSRLEGRFDEFCKFITRELNMVEKRHGSQKEGENYG